MKTKKKIKKLSNIPLSSYRRYKSSINIKKNISLKKDYYSLKM